MSSSNDQKRLQPGQVVTVHSLQSEYGKHMNGQPGIVVCFVPGDDPQQNGRYEVLTPTPTERPTVALKPDNIRPVPSRVPVPRKRERGVVMEPGPGSIATLTELLVRPTDDYEPSETMLMGYAAQALGQIGPGDRDAIGCLDMEQMAGMLSVARIALEGEAMAAEECVAIFLQRESMHLDVVTLLLTQTPYLGPYEDYESSKAWAELDRSWNGIRDNAKVGDFTPDQSHSGYITFMSKGPLMFLKEMSKHSFCSPLFAEIQRTEWFHLVLRRFLRIMAREAEGTPDGRKLGKMCRQIFPSLVSSFDDEGKRITLVSKKRLDELKSTVSTEVARKILENVDSILNDKGSATEEKLEELLSCGQHVS